MRPGKAGCRAQVPQYFRLYPPAQLTQRNCCDDNVRSV